MLCNCKQYISNIIDPIIHMYSSQWANQTLWFVFHRFLSWPQCICINHNRKYTLIQIIYIILKGLLNKSEISQRCHNYKAHVQYWEWLKTTQDRKNGDIKIIFFIVSCSFPLLCHSLWTGIIFTGILCKSSQ